MRDAFARTFMDMCRENKDLFLVGGDSGYNVFEGLKAELPDRYYDAGIAEQSMTGIAAGLALSGKTVFTYNIGNFAFMRCLEFIRNDCAYHRANVKIVALGGGFAYGNLGFTHHATEDISIMRAIPHVTVFTPCDPVETEAVTREAANTPGTCYIRLNRGGDKIIHPGAIDFSTGKPIKIKDGDKTVIFSVGAIAEEVLVALDLLEKDGIHPAYYTFPTVKPLNAAFILECSEQYDNIVTVEENALPGGFGAAVAELLAGRRKHAVLSRIGLDDTFTEAVGYQSTLRKYYNMDAGAIAGRVRSLCK